MLVRSNGVTTDRHSDLLTAALVTIRDSSIQRSGRRLKCLPRQKPCGRVETAWVLLGVYGGMNENFVLVAGRSRWQADGV